MDWRPPGSEGDLDAFTKHQQLLKAQIGGGHSSPDPLLMAMLHLDEPDAPKPFAEFDDPIEKIVSPQMVYGGGSEAALDHLHKAIDPTYRTEQEIHIDKAVQAARCEIAPEDLLKMASEAFDNAVAIVKTRKAEGRLLPVLPLAKRTDPDAARRLKAALAEVRDEQDLSRLIEKFRPHLLEDEYDLSKSFIDRLDLIDALELLESTVDRLQGKAA